jgi:hypothetical protein
VPAGRFRRGYLTKVVMRHPRYEIAPYLLPSAQLKLRSDRRHELIS